MPKLVEVASSPESGADGEFQMETEHEHTGDQEDSDEEAMPSGGDDSEGDFEETPKKKVAGRKGANSSVSGRKAPRSPATPKAATAPAKGRGSSGKKRAREESKQPDKQTASQTSKNSQSPVDVAASEGTASTAAPPVKKAKGKKGKLSLSKSAAAAAASTPPSAAVSPTAATAAAPGMTPLALATPPLSGDSASSGRSNSPASAAAPGGGPKAKAMGGAAAAAATPPPAGGEAPKAKSPPAKSPQAKTTPKAGKAPAKKASTPLAAAAGGGNDGASAGGGAQKAPKAKGVAPAAAAPNAPKAPAPAPAKKKTPRTMIWDYMLKVNRPYSIQNIFDNLQKVVPKPIVQRQLDSLVADGSLSAQEFGKAKLFYPNQNKLAERLGDITPAKLDKLKKQADGLADQVGVVTAELKDLKAEVSTLSSQLRDEELDAELERLQRETSAREERHGAIKAGMKDVDPQAMIKAKTEFNKMRGIWAERKRNCKGMLDQMSEGMEKKPSVVMDLIGMEADEGAIPDKLTVG